MESVYIFGPIHLFGSSYLSVYKRLGKMCRRYSKKVVSTYPDFWKSKESPKRFYNRTQKTITKCNLFIAEVSSPSHGVGMELQMAVQKKIPLIALAKKGSKISIMVKGLPNLKEIIYYNNINDLEKKLEKSVSRMV